MFSLWRRKKPAALAKPQALPRYRPSLEPLETRTVPSVVVPPPPTPQEAIQTLIGLVHADAASLGTPPSVDLARERALVARLDLVLAEVNAHQIPQALRGLQSFENTVALRFALTPAQREALLTQATFAENLILASPGTPPAPITVPPRTTPQEAIQTLIGLVHADAASLGTPPSVALARERALVARLDLVLAEVNAHQIPQALRNLQAFKSTIALRFVPPSAPALLAQATVAEDLILRTAGA